MRKLFIFAILSWSVIMPGICMAETDSSKKESEVVLSPADQLILQAIDKVNMRIDEMGRQLNGRIDEMGRQLNGRIDQVNGRIDNLWITMLSGFLGVMAFIGALVFWDRRTFLNRAREGYRMEMAEERKRIEGLAAALRTIADQFPQVKEALRSFGLL